MLSEISSLTAAAVSAAVALLAALHFPDLTPLGGAILLIGVTGTVWGARAYGKQRAGEAWERTAMGYKEEAEAARERAERFARERVEERERLAATALEERRKLEAERDEQRMLKHEALNSVATLAAKTDLTAVMQALKAVLDTQATQTQILAKLVAKLEDQPPYLLDREPPHPK